MSNPDSVVETPLQREDQHCASLDLFLPGALEQAARFDELTVLEELEHIGSGDDTNGNVARRGHGC